MVSTRWRAEEGGGRQRRGGRACVEKQSGERRGRRAMDFRVGVTCLIRKGEEQSRGSEGGVR